MSLKLQKMLQDLDLSESGGVEAAFAASRHTSSVQSSTPSHDSFQMPAKHSGSDSDDDDIQSDVVSERDAPKPKLPRNMEKRHLESRIIQLMTDNKALNQAAGQANRQRQLEVSQLQGQLSKMVKELEARQAEVESRAPLMSLRVEEFKEQLSSSLQISDARYTELKAMPDESLHVIDLVKIAVHEATAKLAAENEHLRLAAKSARDAAGHASEEAARMRVENARLKVGTVEKDKELNETVESLQARVQHLASELQSTNVRAELLSAKGAMYDKLHEQAEQLRQENQRLQVIEANFKRMEQAHHEMHMQSQETRHTNEMLIVDKAYLSKQVDFLTDAQRRLQAELETKNAKVNHLQNQKQEIFDKMVQAETQKVKDEDKRLQKELSSLQASTHADIERIRLEASESYDREIRLLRELRDQAQEEALRNKIALSDLQETHERQQIHATKATQQLEMQMVELKAEIKQRAFELSHIKVVLGEKEGMLQRANLHNEMLQEKAQVGMDRYRALEGDLSATGGLRSAIGAPGGSAAMQALHEVEELKLQKARVQQEAKQLQAQVVQLGEQLAAAQETLKMMGQPHSFLLQQLQAAKRAKEQLEAQVASLQEKLEVREQAAVQSSKERDALKADLDVLLRQRGQMEALRSMLMHRLSGSAVLQQQQPALGLGQQRMTFPTTTITGEGPQVV